MKLLGYAILFVFLGTASAHTEEWTFHQESYSNGWKVTGTFGIKNREVDDLFCSIEKSPSTSKFRIVHSYSHNIVNLILQDDGFEGMWQKSLRLNVTFRGHRGLVRKRLKAVHRGNLIVAKRLRKKFLRQLYDNSSAKFVLVDQNGPQTLLDVDLRGTEEALHRGYAKCLRERKRIAKQFDRMGDERKVYERARNIVGYESENEDRESSDPFYDSDPSSGTQWELGTQAIGEVDMGRCHMNSCSWARLLKLKKLKSQGGNRLIRLTLHGGSSRHENSDGGADYPDKYHPDLEVEWNKKPHEVYVLCSHKLPTVMWINDGQIDSMTLRFPDVSGAFESSANLYARTCHNLPVMGWAHDGFVRKYGYRVKPWTDETKPLKLESPIDIFKYIP